jgi:hypothetical protein
MTSQNQNESPRNTDLLNEQEAATLLSVAPGTLSVWRFTGRYNVPFIKVGRSVRYSQRALEEWLTRRTCSDADGGKDAK